MSDLKEETAVLSSIKTQFPPCCLQLVADKKHILVGTYDLRKETGYRFGSIDVYKYEKSVDGEAVDLSLVHRYTEDISAILDLKLNGPDRFITAHSTGDLKLWKFNIEEDIVTIELVQKYQVFEKDVLITSCHVKNNTGDSKTIFGNLVLCTGTNGEAKLLDLERANSSFLGTGEDEETNGIYEFNSSHSLECWTGEFGKIAPLENCVFTGGDDSVVKLFDTRTRDEVWSNSRMHEAGVVAIKCANENFRPNKPTSILTGSYDDCIRSFDLRMFSATEVYPGTMPPLNVQTKNLQGGVWRFFEQPVRSNENTNSDQVLVCCMYNGAKIVKISDEFDEESGEEFFQEINYVKEGHESMCYGGDWSSDIIATCSFYDNSLQVWRP